MDDRRKAEELTALLAEIDRDILRAVERRAKVAQDLAQRRVGPARYAPVLDGAGLDALEQSVSPPFPASAVRPLFQTIDAACRIYEVAPRVAFIGAEGGFGWAAARSYFGAGVDLVRAESSVTAIDEVALSRTDFAVVPYETLEDGPIFPTIQLVASRDLKLVGERELTQSLELVNVSGDPNDIEKIYATAEDHVASVKYLESNHPRAMVLDVRSPVNAWEHASESPAGAAIVPRGVITASDLRVARENIGDHGQVRMRYGVLGRLPAPRSGNDATALLFSVRDRPGALHDILQHFKERNCNLRRIQSRPQTHSQLGEEWEYAFYVEVTGHVTDRPLVAALESVKRETKMLKIIGSFPLEFPYKARQEER